VLSWKKYIGKIYFKADLRSVGSVGPLNFTFSLQFPACLLGEEGE
jgi:hypothetical protein